MYKIMAAVSAILVLAGIAYYVTQIKGAPIVADTADTVASTTDTSTANQVGTDMIVVNAQRPGDIVIAAQVHLAAPGFVIVHEDLEGNPGPIVGTSTLLQAGDTARVKIPLNKAAADGTKLHAMLHNDTDGNGIFSEGDAPVQNQFGAVGGIFDISADVPLPPQINI